MKNDGKEPIDLAATHEALVEIEKRIEDATSKHSAFLKELGLAPLPLAKSGKA
jgi:type I restriction enzyme M protein